MAARKRARGAAGEEQFTERELLGRHAYLLRYRRRRLTQLLSLAEERLGQLGVSDAGAAWRLFRLLPNGRGFGFDEGAVVLALGPALLPDVPTTASEERRRAAATDDWLRHRAAIAAAHQLDENDFRAHLYARDANPALYQTVFAPPPAGGRFSEGWLAAEAACLADAALGCVDLDAASERLERAAEQYEHALRGDEAARREVEALRAAASTGRGVLDGAHRGGEARAEPFRETRAHLWRLWLERQPIGRNEFCRQIDSENIDALTRPQNRAGAIVGYDNILHHWKVAKKEHQQQRSR